MSRWKSPQVAALRAERAAKEAEQDRKMMRKSRLMIIGVAVLSIGLVVTDYFWLKSRALKRREEHQRIDHRPVQTDAPPRVSNLSNTNSAQVPWGPCLTGFGFIWEVCSQDANSRFIKCLEAEVLKVHI